jgi:uncharacterized protein YgiM (DUF1202 family)
MKNLLPALTVATLITATQGLPTWAAPKGKLISQRVGPGSYGSAQIRMLYICTRTSSGRLNMRYAAGQQYEVILQIPNGDAVVPMDVTMGSDGFMWHKVSYRGTAGWVRGDYLCG